MNHDDIVLTEFNSNKATLMRIDKALRMAADCSIKDDYNGWFKALAIARREAIVKIKDKTEIDDINKEFLELEKDLSIISKNKQVSSYVTKIDNRLDKFEIKLRGIMDKRGMLLKDNIPDLSGI